MAASKDLLFVVLLAAVLPQHLPPSVGNFLPPLLSPLPEDLCKGMECGKGSCKVSGNITHPYECECEAGWKQFQNLKFLPCVIPNCSLDSSCTKGQPSIQEKSHAANESVFNPCHWADCGGGSCNRTSPLSYNCLCDEGYYNLLNVSVFPCFKQLVSFRGPLAPECEVTGDP
ncbi:hypothetical protein CRG98_027696 [Punica granatum]|uniref:EGF-like domain-containing protein n=1 Tax=Punica granatum TaxID=22663 RepID=A0A2I0J6N4_PUNGR|nr:hypothetical protein CRG98_027696 [Punica granatum]